MEKITSNDIRFTDLTVKRFNKRFIGKPEYFYLPETTSDVITAVQDAVDAQKRLVVRSGGYCLEGFVSDPSVQVLIDMSLMKGISYNVERSAFEIEAGALSGRCTANSFWGGELFCRPVSILT